MNRNWIKRAPTNLGDHLKKALPSTMFQVHANKIFHLMIDHDIKTRKQLSQMSNVRESILRQMLNEEIATKRMLTRVAEVLGVQWEELVKR